MIFKSFRRTSLAAATGVVLAGAPSFAVHAAEPVEASYWRASYGSASNHWRASKRAVPRALRSRRRPPQQWTAREALPERLGSGAACVTLSCPGYILLGVGF